MFFPIKIGVLLFYGDQLLQYFALHFAQKDSYFLSYCSALDHTRCLLSRRLGNCLNIQTFWSLDVFVSPGWCSTPLFVSFLVIWQRNFSCCHGIWEKHPGWRLVDALVMMIWVDTCLTLHVYSRTRLLLCLVSSVSFFQMWKFLHVSKYSAVCWIQSYRNCQLWSHLQKFQMTWSTDIRKNSTMHPCPVHTGRIINYGPFIAMSVKYRQLCFSLFISSTELSNK